MIILLAIERKQISIGIGRAFFAIFVHSCLISPETELLKNDGNNDIFDDEDPMGLQFGARGSDLVDDDGEI